MEPTGGVTVGASLSLSGRFAVQGEQARRGLQLWSEGANRDGGLIVRSPDDRQRVNLIVYDDQSKRDRAAAATERLIVQDQVDLLFSPYSSVLAIAAAEVAEHYGRILWNHGGSSDALDARGWRHVVTLLTPASHYFESVLEMAVSHGRPSGQPVRTIALLHGSAGTFAEAVADGAERHAARLGLQVVLRAAYLPPPDLSPLVRHIADLQPDLILGVGTTEADLAFAREARRRCLTASVFALVAAPIEHFRDALEADADGFCGPSQWEPTLQNRPDLGPTSAEFAAAFKRRFGTEPDYPAAQAYAAGLIAARCAQAAGSFEDRALRRAAGVLEVSTFYGRFRLDPSTGQQVGHRMVIVQWQAGRKQIVWPPAAATASYQLPVPTAAPTLRPSDDGPSS